VAHKIAVLLESMELKSSGRTFGSLRLVSIVSMDRGVLINVLNQASSFHLECEARNERDLCRREKIYGEGCR
jgi:hypothetical protein